MYNKYTVIFVKSMHCNPSSNQIKKGPLYYITVAIIIIDL